MPRWLPRPTLGWFCLALFLIALVANLRVSERTPKAGADMNRMLAAEQVESIVLAVAEHGPAELNTLQAKQAYAAAPNSAFATLLGAWAKLSLARVGLVSSVTAVRLPYLFVTALSPALLLLLARDLGSRVAIWAAVGLLLTPAWRGAAAVASAGSVLASAWIIVLWAYLRSQRRPGRSAWCWALLSASALGVLASFSWGVLWLLPLMALHFGLTRRALTSRLAARGRLPAPLAVVLSVAAAPLLLMALNPMLWGSNATAIARAWLLPIAAPTLVDRNLVLPLLRATPIALLVFTLIGGAQLIAQRVHAARFLRFVRREPLDSATLTLIVLGLGCVIVGRSLVPSVFASPEPYWELALPFVAVLGALGLTNLSAKFRPGRYVLLLEVVGACLIALTG